MVKSFTDIFRSRCIFNEKGQHSGGTDRSSNHNYGDAYEQLFPNRDEIKLLMEIGNADGAGMLAFRDALPNAHIVGMDITDCACPRGPRLEFHRGDQRNKAECERAATNNGTEPDRRFDAIIEDGYHDFHHTMATLFWLWPFVKRGGIYVVEEWHNVCADMANIKALFPMVEVIDTVSPHGGGNEPLIVFRKNKRSDSAYWPESE